MNINLNKLVKRSRKIVVFSFIFIFLLIGGGVIYLFNPFNKMAEAAWFDDNWSYRVPLTIANSGAADTNKKVKFDIDTASLITAGQMQSDCDDSRFTDLQGNLLRYYIDSAGGACNGASTDYYILIPVINGSNSTIIYHYYGNPSAVAGTEGAQFSEGTFSPTSTSSGTEEKAPSPTLYWKFDDATGTNAQDSTQNNLDGTLANGPTWQTEDFCISAKCLYFAGTDDNVNKSDDSKLDFAAADSFTIQAWVKRNGPSSANNFIITKAQSGYTGYKLYMDASGDFCFDVSDGSNTDTACTSAIDFDNDKWHFVSGVKSGTSSITLYVDGNQRAQDASIAATGTLINTGAFYVGVDLDGISNEWLGFIDEVKAYSFALSGAQIKSNYIARGVNKGASASVGNTNLQPLSDGLIGYWKMNESSYTGNCSASDILDSSGNSTGGKVCPNGAGPSAATGKFGRATSFTGASSQYVTMSDLSILEPAGNKISISGWVKTSISNAYMGIGSKYNTGTTGYALQTDDVGRLHGIVGNGSSQGKCTSTTVIADNLWHFLVVTYDGSEVRCYVDGKLENTVSLSGNISYDTAEFDIGARDDNTDFFTGSIDEIRVYSRSLSNQEVSQFYSWAPGPFGYWKMDEGSWTNDCSTQTVFDSSTNSFNLPACPASTGPSGGTLGKVGKAGTFDGSDDYLESTSTTMADLTTDNITITAWLYKATPATVDVVVAKKATILSTDAGYYMYINATGKATMLISDGTDQFQMQTVGSINSNQWTFVSAVIDRQSTTKSDIFFNGIKQNATQTGTLSAVDSLTNSRNLAIAGQDAGNTLYEGKIDDLKIYNYDRTPKQMTEDMNGGHPAVGSPVSSPIGHWKFNEGYGTTANNSGSLASSAVGTLTSSPTWTNSGKYDKALSFSANYVDVANESNFDFSSDFTLSFWINIDSTNNNAAFRGLMGKYSSGNPTGWDLGISDSKIWMALRGSSIIDTLAAGTALTAETWYHVSVVNTPTSVKIYINGILDRTVTGTWTADTSDTQTLHIGNRGFGGNAGFVGELDDVKIYDYGLTDSEVRTDFNRSSSLVLGTLSDNSSYQRDAANQEYCVPGDTTSCASPVGRWNFEEKSGTTANDTSGNNLAGTLQDNAAWGVGKVGAGINFDGSGDYISVGSSSTLQPTSAITYQAWVKINTFGDRWLISNQNSTWNVNTGYQLRDNSPEDTLGCGVGHGASATSAGTAVLSTKTWYHIACVFDGSTLKVYLNGTLVNSAAAGAATIDYTSSTLNFGAKSQPSFYLLGSMDSVRIYNYARSASQVAWDYNHGGPIAYWKFDECQGITNYNSVSTSYNGTINNDGGGSQATSGTCATSASSQWYNGRNGKRNYSLSYDGTDDWVNMGTTLGNFTATDSFSVSTWFYIPSLPSANQGIVSRMEELPSVGWQVRIKSDNSIRFVLASDGSNFIAADTSTISTGWNHIVAVYNGSTPKTYLNGKLNSTTVTSGTLGTITGVITLFVGKDTSTFFAGQIDETQIYSYALTAGQVKTIYNGGAVQFSPITGTP